jgi:hypothetical protein
MSVSCGLRIAPQGRSSLSRPMRIRRIAFIALLITVTSGFAATPQSTETGSVNTPGQLANANLILSPDSMAMFTAKAEPHERFAIVFAKELYRGSLNRDPGTLTYYLAAFDRSTRTWGKCSGGIGLPHLKEVPISARGIHIEWTGGDISGWLLNYQPDAVTVELLPREQFDALFPKKNAKK